LAWQKGCSRTILERKRKEKKGMHVFGKIGNKLTDRSIPGSDAVTDVIAAGIHTKKRRVGNRSQKNTSEKSCG